MVPIVGVYKSRTAAERGTVELRSEGVAEDKIHLLTPHLNKGELALVPTTEGEQPGMLKAIGAVTGGAAGLGMGAGLAALLVPGIGPVLAIGAAGGLLLGGLAGGELGNVAEKTVFAGLPEDELFVYEDALRQGRSVVVAMAENGEQENAVRNIFTQTGAESIDRAREMWWLGLRGAETEHYQAHGGNSQQDEKELRRGFEAAQHPKNRGRSYEECNSTLQERYPDTWNSAAFRQGYERGCKYYEERRKLKVEAGH
jgi:hypothetical protein